MRKTTARFHRRAPRPRRPPAESARDVRGNAPVRRLRSSSGTALASADQAATTSGRVTSSTFPTGGSLAPSAKGGGGSDAVLNQRPPDLFGALQHPPPRENALRFFPIFELQLYRYYIYSRLIYMVLKHLSRLKNLSRTSVRDADHFRHHLLILPSPLKPSLFPPKNKCPNPPLPGP